ncbi:MAG: hypothetical protein QMD23_00790 [Candidatus Bathyarchaeia archaeon]|nr:hypothetical protein [Candidatus Bathyarchaeia archaeon]
MNGWGKEEARESGEGEETYGVPKRKEEEKEESSFKACQKKEEVGVV